MCSLWHWLILVFLLDLSCSAYNPFFALQKWPLEVPHWFHRVFSTPDTPHFYSPSLQSPINIRSSHAAVLRLPPLIFKDLFRDEVELQCQNTGTTVEFELPEHTSWRPKLLGGPLFNEGVFEFDNLHIHWGARDFIGGEHKINSRRYAVEGHCVHFNSKYGNKSEAMKHPDGLAVVAFFGKAGNTDNPLVEKLVRKLPYIRLPGSSITVNAHEALEWLEELGEPRNYFAYPGSLTTPPYTENVMWIVYPRPVSLSSRQVEAFRNILSNNYQLLRKNIRPVQSFNSRPLIYAV
ncbi:carbonic anhydrase 2-like isoform X2 [Macrosteles quadrilineatus]|nr:carbonic anhydrase 2-like isoform X2 [Macrosteles quadrilineatus]XP_054272324.1 carbonic anhydrase 2-like isoform X2 [Macrosteles quadrilineatus]